MMLLDVEIGRILTHALNHEDGEIDGEMRLRLPSLAIALLVACSLSAMSAMSRAQTDDAARADLAPSGTLRAAINLGNPVLANRDAATGEPRGVSVDLTRELATRLKVPHQLVIYTAAGRGRRGCSAGARFLAEFVEEMKATGFVAASLTRHGIEGAIVAPAAP